MVNLCFAACSKARIFVFGSDNPKRACDSCMISMGRRESDGAGTGYGYGDGIRQTFVDDSDSETGTASVNSSDLYDSVRNNTVLEKELFALMMKHDQLQEGYEEALRVNKSMIGDVVSLLREVLPFSVTAGILYYDC